MPAKNVSAPSTGSPRRRTTSPANKAAVPTATTHRHWPQSDKSPPGTGGIPFPASRGLRTSVNVYGSDLDCLEPLRVFLRKQTGLRVIKDSTLIQVLCRTCQPSPTHVAALQAVQQTTSRRYRS